MRVRASLTTIRNRKLIFDSKSEAVDCQAVRKPESRCAEASEEDRAALRNRKGLPLAANHARGAEKEIHLKIP